MAEGPTNETGGAPQADEVAKPDPAEGGAAAEPAQPSDRAKPRGLGALQALGWVFVFALISVGVLVGALAYRLIGPTTQPPERIVETVRSGPDVVVAVRDLARLETASYHVERVIDLRQQQRILGLLEAEDALLLVAAGDVTAGIDLTRMEDGDVVIEPEASRAVLTLPAPEIFDARLDNERTYVHTRETSLLARRDAHLETRARREAEATLRDSAREAGILDRARANAATAITSLVRSLGYDQVEIRWKDAPPPNAERPPQSAIP